MRGRVAFFAGFTAVGHLSAVFFAVLGTALMGGRSFVMRAMTGVAVFGCPGFGL